MKQKNKQKVAAKMPEKSLPFFAMGALFIALSLFLAFVPGVTRGWGLNYIAFFDPWVIGLFYLCLLCFWLPQTNQYLVEKITAFSRQSIVATLRKHRYALFVVISLCAVGVFHLLRNKYVFLGDFDLIAQIIEKPGAESRPDEYLSMLILSRSYVWLHAHFDFTGVQTMRLADDIVGSLFIFVGLCIANLLGNTFLKKAAVFIISTLSCAILMQFCGYLEVYSLPAFGLQLYLFTSLLYLKDKIHIIVPALVIFTGVALHSMLVCMLPSLVFMFYGKVLWKRPFFRSKKTIGGIVVVSLPFLYMAFNGFAIPMMLPMEDDVRMTLLSITNFKEFFNSQLLGGGIGFLIWLMLLIYSARGKVKYDFTAWFFLIASLSIAGLLFVFDGMRGSGDWDIYSFAAVVFNLSNARVLLGGGVQGCAWSKNLKYGILMLAGFSICHTSMWLLINRTDASIKWVERALSTDPGSYYKLSFSNEATLSVAFKANKLDDLAMKWQKKEYLKHRDDPRSGYNYALRLLDKGKDEEAVAILTQNIRDFPAYVLPYSLLLNHFLEIRDYEMSYKVLVQLEQVYKQEPQHLTSRWSQEQIDQFWAQLAALKELRAAGQ
ncbi:hypothetical protein AGMMS49965_18800 [Bacteroidia bacterium]|nr:hypothetical protein AGMMS49965_18800 [Bacteroidia bacterium]